VSLCLCGKKITTVCLGWINKYKSYKNQDDSQKNPPFRVFTEKGDGNSILLFLPPASDSRGAGEALILIIT
jgi:hypothetical protein